ncbi:MAG: DNA/RNA non-specific endonuclease [Pyrinomonadaceae bacterium]
MKNKVATGGIIALILIILVIIFCVWAGKKINEKLTGINPTPENTGQNQPGGQSPPSLPASASEAEKIYLALGNPSKATATTSNPDNYLMVNTAYALSYNNSKGTANWVAWRVTESNLGDAERQNDFRIDDRLPKNFNRIKPTDYTRSGFDRGHLCPSADRAGSEEANSETFLMTNMVPQTADLNRNLWERLESYSRGLVKRGKVDLYIIAGVYGEKGRLKKKVTVPTNCWKIVVAVPQGAGISAINDKTHIIAVDMPNADGIAKEDWRKFRTTVRAIEQRTGYDFFSNLPTEVQNQIEVKKE